MAYDPRPSTPIKHLTESIQVCSVAWAKCLLLSQPRGLHLAIEVFGAPRAPGALLSRFSDSSLPSYVAALTLGNTVSLQYKQFPFAVLCSKSNQQRLLGQKGEVPAAARQGGAGGGPGLRKKNLFLLLFYFSPSCWDVWEAGWQNKPASLGDQGVLRSTAGTCPEAPPPNVGAVPGGWAPR